MHALQSICAPVGRVLMAWIFLSSGVGKIGAYAATQSNMESVGLPGGLLPLVIAVEVLGGIAILLGWHTRITAFLLAGFTLLAALFFHTDFSSHMQVIQFEKNLAIGGGFLMLVAHGAGAFSLDAQRRS